MSCLLLRGDLPLDKADEYIGHSLDTYDHCADPEYQVPGGVRQLLDLVVTFPKGRKLIEDSRVYMLEVRTSLAGITGLHAAETSLKETICSVIWTKSVREWVCVACVRVSVGGCLMLVASKLPRDLVSSRVCKSHI